MCQQCISGQDSGCFTEHLMIRELATPVIIIIHGRQIIMNQRVGMHHLNRRRYRQCCLPAASERFAGSDYQQRAKALASGLQGIIHRFL
ncbi:hypothetical protein D3C74_367060 [compost metagenome]